jgi:hypothetical protein
MSRRPPSARQCQSGRQACVGHGIDLRTELKLHLVEAGPGEQAGNLRGGEQLAGLVQQRGHVLLGGQGVPTGSGPCRKAA